MNLMTGNIAPNFEAHGSSGPIRFHQWTGNSWTIIFSHPGSSFQTELTEVSRRFPDIEKRGVKVLGFSRNWLDDHRHWNSINQKYGRKVGSVDSIIQILADDGGQLSALYAMLPNNNRDTKGSSPNTVFLIDPNKVIRTVLSYPSTISTRLYQLLRLIDDATHTNGLEEINTESFGLDSSGHGQIYSAPKSSKGLGSTVSLLSSAIGSVSPTSPGGVFSTSSMSSSPTALASTATNYIENALHLASTLSDLGQTVPFIAPAFVLLKTIISVEQRAREADTKCTDLVQRVTFMLSHLPALKQLKKVEDTTRQVIDQVNDVLKEAASFIEAYRKQGLVARRLKLGNRDRFETLAKRLRGCTKDLMVSLQIQQSVQMEVLIERGVPRDVGDEDAERFTKVHGGEEKVRESEELVRMFAEEMKVKVDDVGSVMRDLNINMLDVMKENQERLEKTLNESVSNSVIAGLKGLAEQMNEKEKEQVFHCVQCDKDYRLSTNGEKSCGYHKAAYDSWKKSFPCCAGNENAPCEAGMHRAKHHCDYPYGAFFAFAWGINGYVDTKDVWAKVEDVNLRTNANGDTQVASIGRLLKWKSKGAQPELPTILIQVGNVSFRERYFFKAFSTKDLEVTSRVVEITHQMTIFRTSGNEEEFAMAEWILSQSGDGIITGVKLTAKSATSTKPYTRVCPINITTLEKPNPEDILELSKGGLQVYKPSEPYVLPEVQRVSGDLPDKAPREVRKGFKTRTSSSEMKILLQPSDDPPLEANPQYAFYESDYFVGSFSVFNKHAPGSQNCISIASVKAFYRLVGEETYRPVLKVEILDGNGSATEMPMSIDPRQTKTLKLGISVPRTDEDTKLQTRWWNRAFVARQKPLRIKIVLVDIEDDEASLVVDYVCPVFPPTKASKPSWGNETIGFFHIDDLGTWERHSVEVVKLAKGGVRIGSSWELDESRLKTLVFSALESGDTEIALEDVGEEKDTWNWKSWALVDLSCRRVYGFKILIMKPGARAGKGLGCIGYVVCPEYGEVLDEVRVVRYAREKIGLPEMEPWVEEEVVWDDELDDVVLGPEPEKREGATSGAGAGAGVGLVLPEALDRRLASIDKSLERLAVAFEQLVEIMKAK